MEDPISKPDAAKGDGFPATLAYERRLNNPTQTALPRTCPVIAATTAARVWRRRGADGRHVEHRVERVQLEHVVMHRT